MSAFNGVESAPPIEVFKLTRDFQVNTDPNKVSLEVGAYRTDEGKPEWIIHEYLPVLGHDRFAVNATKMLLGPDSKALKAGLAFGIQQWRLFSQAIRQKNCYVLILLGQA